MKYKISLTLNNNRKTPIFSHYRPDWVTASKPEYNGAQVLLSDRDMLHPGESCECTLQPFASEFWHDVKVGETLFCMEGAKKVGEAIILEIVT